MSFSGFSHDDFNVFTIPGLDQRMEALKETVRPKLEGLGNYFAPTLSSLTGDEMFPHVAKHARRTINPPKDSWVAFANNSRGYKMLPHFQIGLWETHVFIWFAVIYEAPKKAEIGQALSNHLDKIYQMVPNDFVWSGDHTKPDGIKHGSLTKTELSEMFTRLQNVKKAEILCGYHIDREDAVKLTSAQFLDKVDSVFKQLIPLYKLS